MKSLAEAKRDFAVMFGHAPETDDDFAFVERTRRGQNDISDAIIQTRFISSLPVAQQARVEKMTWNQVESLRLGHTTMPKHSGPGLPATYIKRHHGDMKAAWKDYKDGGGVGQSAAQAKRKRGGFTKAQRAKAKKARQQRAAHDKDGVARRGMHAEVHRRASVTEVAKTKPAHPSAKHGEKYTRTQALDVWAGIFAELKRDARGSGYRIPHNASFAVWQPWMGNTGADRADITPAQREVYARAYVAGEHRERGRVNEVHPREALHHLGHTMADSLHSALNRHHMTRAQWAALYDGAMVLGAHPEQNGWISPLQGPTRITSAFGSTESFRSTPHTGIDLAAAAGSTVVAPIDMKVTKIGTTKDGNNYVRAVARRPDGQFPSESLGAGLNRRDDSGWRIGFDHLSAMFPNVGEDMVIRQGQPFAFSGGAVGADGSGDRTTGPHLHMALEWEQENTLINDRVFVDPAALIAPHIGSSISAVAGGGIIAPGVEHAPRPGAATAVRTPKGVDGATAEKRAVKTTVIINNNGLVGIGQNLQNQEGAITQGDIFGGVGSELLSDDEVRGVVLSPMSSSPFTESGFFGALPQMGSVLQEGLQGLGNLAGRVFSVVASPQGIGLVGKLAGGGFALASGASAAASLLGPLLAPLIAAVPYANVLAPVFEAAGPIGAFLAPTFGALGAASQGLAKAFESGAEFFPGIPTPMSAPMFNPLAPSGFVDMQGQPIGLDTSNQGPRFDMGFPILP